MKDKIECMEGGKQRMKEDMTSMIQLLHQIASVSEEERSANRGEAQN